MIIERFIYLILKISPYLCMFIDFCHGFLDKYGDKRNDTQKEGVNYKG